MKGKITYPALMTGLFCGFLSFFACLSLFLPKQSFSDTENRYLAQFPAFSWEDLKTGKFGEAYEEYLSDQFPFRNRWIGVKTASEELQMKKEINGVFLGKDHYLIEAHYPEDFDEALREKNLARLQTFAATQGARLGKDHVRLLLAPSASEILTDKLPAFASPMSQKTVTDQLSGLGLSDYLVPVREALLQAACGADPLYYRTDHHWTVMGAYEAYDTWARSIGLSPLPLSNFQPETVTTDFLGTVHSKLNLSSVPDSITLLRPVKEPDWNVYYDGGTNAFHSLYQTDALKTRDKYRIFLDGNHGLTKIENPDVKNGRKLLIVKDSFANSFAPFAALHFEETHMIDLRYFNGQLSAMIKDAGITDLLVLYQIPGLLKDRDLIKLTW